MHGNYQSTHYSPKSWVTLGAVVFVLFFMERVSLLVPVRAFGEQMVSPLQIAAVRVAKWMRRPIDLVTQYYAKMERYDDVERRYGEALSQLEEITQLRKENEELRRLLQQPPAADKQRSISAPIVSLARPMVSAGAQQGVARGALVSSSGTLLGIIDSVSPQQSSVALLTRQQEMAILAKTEAGIEGVIRSEGGRIILDELPRESTIPEGERVTTVGQEGIPSGLLIGVTGVTQQRVTAPVQSVIVVQPVSFYEVSVVEVVW